MGYATVEVRLLKKMVSGYLIYLQGHCSNSYFENQLCLLGMGIDISQRVNAEEELRISEQNLVEYNRELNLLNAINDVILRNEDELELYREVCELHCSDRRL